MHPKVSIQIPTYNQHKFIQQTLESCLMQDYPNLEINIADDHSTDKTTALLQPYLQDKRVRYFNNETNIGRVANYNKALYEYATGEWAINLDGDDYFIDPAFISTAMALIGNMPEEQILVYQANQDIHKIMKVIPGCKQINETTVLTNGPDYFANYYKVNHFFHGATLYKREEALKLDFYYLDCLFTDFNSVARLFLKGKIIFSAKEVAVWNSHDNNVSSTIDGAIIYNELAAINALADFSSAYLPAKTVSKWRRMMKGYLLSSYIDKQLTLKAKRIALKNLLLNFSFDKVHLRQLTKVVLGSIGLR